jgi:hypothetical protein
MVRGQGIVAYRLIEAMKKEYAKAPEDRTVYQPKA